MTGILDPEALGRHFSEKVKAGVSQGDKDVESLSPVDRVRVQTYKNSKVLQHLLSWAIPSIAACCAVAVRYPEFWWYPIPISLAASFLISASSQKARDKFASELKNAQHPKE